MVVPGQFDEPSPGRVRSDVAALLDHLETITGPVQHQRGNLHRGEDVSDVRLLHRTIARDRVAGARRQAQELAERPHEALIVRERRGQHLEEVTHERGLPPLALDARVPLLEVMSRPEGLVVGRRRAAHQCALDDHTRRSLRMRRSERETERGAALDPE